MDRKRGMSGRSKGEGSNIMEECWHQEEIDGVWERVYGLHSLGKGDDWRDILCLIERTRYSNGREKYVYKKMSNEEVDIWRSNKDNEDVVLSSPSPSLSKTRVDGMLRGGKNVLNYIEDSPDDGWEYVKSGRKMRLRLRD